MQQRQSAKPASSNTASAAAKAPPPTALDTSEQDAVIREFERDARRQANVFRALFCTISVVIAGVLTLMAARLDHHSPMMMSSQGTPGHHAFHKRLAPLINAALVAVAAVQVARLRPSADLLAFGANGKKESRAPLKKPLTTVAAEYAALVAALLHAAVCLAYAVDDDGATIAWTDVAWAVWPPLYQLIVITVRWSLLDEAAALQRLDGSRYEFHTA